MMQGTIGGTFGERNLNFAPENSTFDPMFCTEHLKNTRIAGVGGTE